MYVDGWMNVWMFECMDALMYGCMDIWMYGCIDGWTYGWMDIENADRATASPRVRPQFG